MVLLVFFLLFARCAHFQRLEAIYEHLSRRRKSFRRWLLEEALGTIALGASARIGPLRRELVKAFRKGLEGRPHDRALLGSFCAKRPSADKAYNHRTSWNQRVTISAEAAPYAYHISNCESECAMI
jgi:hypothetical protein